MSFFFGLVIGVAVGIALIVGFVRSENARSLRRSQLATTIAAFARMTVEDSRKILAPEYYPSWVVFSQRQKARFISFSVCVFDMAQSSANKDLAAASELIKTNVEPVLEQYRPIILSSLKFSKFTLGTVAPQFTGVSIIEDGGGSITMELEMNWDGNPSIVLDIKTRLGVALPVQDKTEKTESEVRQTCRCRGGRRTTCRVRCGTRTTATTASFHSTLVLSPAWSRRTLTTITPSAATPASPPPADYLSDLARSPPPTPPRNITARARSATGPICLGRAVSCLLAVEMKYEILFLLGFSDVFLGGNDFGDGANSFKSGLNGGLYDSRLGIMVKDIGFTGVFRLIFKPLVDEFPCFGAICYSLRQKKKLDFTLKVIGGDISTIPGLSGAIEGTIRDAIEDSITWPVRKIVPILPGDYSDLELKPVGVLEVKLVQAKELTNKDIIGKSDPFAVLYIRPLRDRMKTSKTINNQLNPVWNEHFEFIVEDSTTQHLVVKVYDDEGLQAEELIGCAQIRLNELEPGKVKDVWLKLVKDLDVQRDNKNRGQVHLELLYCPYGMKNAFTNPFASDFSMTSLEKVFKSGVDGKDTAENGIDGKNKRREVIVRGVLSVTVISADDLAPTDVMGKADPYVALILKKTEAKNKTRVVNDCLNPVWNQTFDFVVEDGLHDMLILEVYDHDTFGKVEIPACSIHLPSFLSFPSVVRGARRAHGASTWVRRNHFDEARGLTHLVHLSRLMRFLDLIVAARRHHCSSSHEGSIMCALLQYGTRLALRLRLHKLLCLNAPLAFNNIGLPKGPCLPIDIVQYSRDKDA
ncbi:calcium-dependent lipid-binding (CaLB domain) family protein [Actinidia rufa]|uniref:Calcium-dependent lipid-binding (CaLB domain) family protein n=1 Tax=Actinidia rufa TaxID=165716 RepID=A0A7J0FXG5_9ERIC|nr:calcium-dependent lipid-binding (CaLB domain) family protein [Actinidia rufa]